MYTYISTKTSNFKNKKGFTLIEILFYIALLIILMGVMITSMFSLFNAFEKNRTERALTHAATIVLERIVREARFANYIHEGLSSFGTSPGKLVLVESAKQSDFYVSGGAIMYAENSIDIGPLTPSNVLVEDIVFTHLENSVTEAVHIELTLSVREKAASTTKKFYTSAVLRRSYE